MSRLSEIFGTRNKCFLPFVTAGHPDLETTLEILLELAAAGSDIIELGGSVFGSDRRRSRYPALFFFCPRTRLLAR